MTAPLPSAPSRDDLIDRLSKGHGLTYGERTHLGDPTDLAFVDARIDALESRRRWYSVVIAGLLLVAIVLVLIAGGATLDPATWWPARPREFTLLGLIPVVAMSAFTLRALSQKLGIYRALRVTAECSPTDPSQCASV